MTKLTRVLRVVLYVLPITMLLCQVAVLSFAPSLPWWAIVALSLTGVLSIALFILAVVGFRLVDSIIKSPFAAMGKLMGMKPPIAVFDMTQPGSGLFDPSKLGVGPILPPQPKEIHE